MDLRIQQLYRQLDTVKSLIQSKEHAVEVVRKLSQSAGWRERCSAALVVTEFRLGEQIPLLVETFKSNPEIHTCRCFTRMITEVLHQTGLQYLVTMKESCNIDARGLVLIKEIDNAIQRIQKA
ncbi:MAG TPA: hypothetical protein DEP47_09575 [Chloroflexi bacterium]|nr:hypothetical protein [Chloroflexota bacterium]